MYLPTPWDFTARSHLRQKQGALLLTMMLRTLHRRGTRRGGGEPTSTRGRRRLHMTCPRLLLGRVRKTCGRLLQVHDLWWTPQVNMSTLLTLVGCEEHSLPAPRPAGPCPELCFELPPPPADVVTNHPTRASQWRACRIVGFIIWGPSPVRTNSCTLAVETVPYGYL